MAQVKWTDEADALFDKYIMNAFEYTTFLSPCVPSPCVPITKELSCST